MSAYKYIHTYNRDQQINQALIDKELLYQIYNDY